MPRPLCKITVQTILTARKHRYSLNIYTILPCCCLRTKHPHNGIFHPQCANFVFLSLRRLQRRNKKAEMKISFSEWKMSITKAGKVAERGNGTLNPGHVHVIMHESIIIREKRNCNPGTQNVTPVFSENSRNFHFSLPSPPRDVATREKNR